MIPIAAKAAHSSLQQISEASHSTLPWFIYTTESIVGNLGHFYCPL